MRKKFFSVLLIVLGISLIGFKFSIGGAVIGSGEIFSWLFYVGLLSLVSGCIIFLLNLDDIIRGETEKAPKRLIKTAEYIGKKAICRIHGSLPPNIKNKERIYRELGEILLSTKGLNEQFSREEINKKYTFHQLPESAAKDLKLPEGKYFTYDALELSTGHRGKERYVFDSEGNFIGVITHERSAGKMRYHWLK